jgi:hypothetical protein
VLYNYPGKSADFYQDIVDKFIKIINCENICEEYRKFILHLNAPDKVGNNGKK